MSCGYIFNLELVNTFVCTPNFSQHLEVRSDMKFSHLLNVKFYSKYRIDILFIIQTCLKSQKICCEADVVHYGAQEGDKEALTYSGIFVESIKDGVSAGWGKNICPIT